MYNKLDKEIIETFFGGTSNVISIPLTSRLDGSKKFIITFINIKLFDQSKASEWLDGSEFVRVDEKPNSFIVHAKDKDSIEKMELISNPFEKFLVNYFENFVTNFIYE